MPEIPEKSVHRKPIRIKKLPSNPMTVCEIR